MKRSKWQASGLGGSPDDTESAFYEAMQNADLELMMSCWAEDDDVVCVHPGGSRVVGANAIRGVFEAMFNNGGIQAMPEKIHKIESLASAVHHLVEKVAVSTPEGLKQAYVIATNVYHKTPQGWRMVAHHASPGTAQEAKDVGVKPTFFH